MHPRATATRTFLSKSHPAPMSQPFAPISASNLNDAEVITPRNFAPAVFPNGSTDGAGVAPIGGAILGVIVGTVIVAQTLYSSTRIISTSLRPCARSDHLPSISIK